MAEDLLNPVYFGISLSADDILNCVQFTQQSNCIVMRGFKCLQMQVNGSKIFQCVSWKKLILLSLDF